MATRVSAVGEEALIDLTRFSTSGKSSQDLRTARNRLTRLGHSIAFHSPPLHSALLLELRGISDDWLRSMNGSEKRFSVGWLDDDDLRESHVAVARTPEGKATAFANLVSENQLNQITIDRMRHRTDMIPGTMDFLFLALFQYSKEQRTKRFSLGLSAFSGVRENPTSARIEKEVHYLFRQR